MKYKWTKDSLAIEALKYTSKGEFQKKSNAAYQSAVRQKLISKICCHMPEDKKIGRESPLKKWNLKSISIEALKYNSRTEFQQKNGSAYCIACKLKIINFVCSHMNRVLSKPEDDLKKIIKVKYPSARKIRNGKYEIDIFILELNKGIEFDGSYWHSIEGLKRSYLTKSIEELQNYHKNKDDYFLSKGIEILHIKEEDWLSDSKKCIENSYNFLGVF